MSMNKWYHLSIKVAEICSLVIMVLGLSPNGVPGGSLQMKNRKHAWMTMMSSQLEDMRLGDVLLPGTHNSASYTITSSNAVLVEKILPSFLAFTFAKVRDTMNILLGRIGFCRSDRDSAVKIGEGIRIIRPVQTGLTLLLFTMFVSLDLCFSTPTPQQMLL